MELKTVIAQLHIKKMKPVCTDGPKEIGRPFDKRDSFCVSNPHPSPTSKLKVGPAKLLERENKETTNKMIEPMP